MWRLVELSAGMTCRSRFTPVTGIQGSNPMNLVDLIADPRPSSSCSTGVSVGRRDGRDLDAPWFHVWLDSVWMPTLSYTTAKRAFHEWLDVMPSDRIMWGASTNHAKEIYGQPS